MVARALSVSSASPTLPAIHATAAPRESAEIHAYPHIKLPPLDDYARACRDLIFATFPASSQNGVCERAAAFGIASPDTFDRILAGKTKRIDGHIMRCVCAVAASRGVTIPAALGIRLIEQQPAALVP